MKTLLLIFCLCFSLASNAFEPNHEEIKAHLLRAELDSVLAKLDSEAPELGSENSEYYAIALIADGRLVELKAFLDTALERYPNNSGLLSLKTHVQAFLAYQVQPQRLLPYFDTSLNYLLNLSESQALDLVKQNSKKLFPKTLDFYKVAMAYRALAISSVKTKDIKNATRFAKLAKGNIYKMRSIWLEEDIIVNNKLMKTSERSTKFAYVFPQWIMALRDEFESYLN